MLRIGLLRMCELGEPAIAAHGTYWQVFRDWFDGGADRQGVELVDIAIHEGDAPTSIDDCDGWVISGSPASTYDGHDWIATGEEIVRTLVAAERPTVGICFGHQLMAQAHGGRVERSPEGWGAGAHRYRVTGTPPSALAEVDELTILAMHQDQVMLAPAGAEVWLTSTFCPIAGLTYGERAWSIQPHPEFSPRLVEAICHDRRLRMGDDTVAAAIASLDAPLDGHRVADATVATALA